MSIRMIRYNINEIFYSIQAEGYNAGMPAVFIRFAGCDRECGFCDTNYSTKIITNIKGIEKEIKKYNCSNIILTGGEPTIQPISKLIYFLHSTSKFRYKIYVETNGYNLEEAQDANWITFSPKCMIDIETHHIYNELKIVYYGQNIKPYRKYRLASPDCNFLQPCISKEKDWTMETIEYIKKYPEWRLSLQWQKLIGIR